ncbi:MAG TPA: hypothetical protein VK838_05250 [Candidatus Limnocylindrales bacterium]|nr:hypothetical protein [Candidatus Limnocylindrales bacterium]
MRDELATVLRLVAEGKLSPDEAAPLIEALGTGQRSEARADHPGQDHAGRVRGRRVRIQVSERGRRVVDLRVPLAFAAMAARAVPGIPDSYASMIEQAVEGDTNGTIVDTEDEGGDRVLITVE